MNIVHLQRTIQRHICSFIESNTRAKWTSIRHLKSRQLEKKKTSTHSLSDTLVFFSHLFLALWIRPCAPSLKPRTLNADRYVLFFWSLIRSLFNQLCNKVTMQNRWLDHLVQIQPWCVHFFFLSALILIGFWPTTDILNGCIYSPSINFNW